jgi:hypothetical protein
MQVTGWWRSSPNVAEKPIQSGPSGGAAVVPLSSDEGRLCMAVIAAQIVIEYGTRGNSPLHHTSSTTPTAEIYRLLTLILLPGRLLRSVEHREFGKQPSRGPVHGEKRIRSECRWDSGPNNGATGLVRGERESPRGRSRVTSDYVAIVTHVSCMYLISQ